MQEREGVIMGHDHEKLVRTSVYLEEEVLEALEELAEEYSKDTGQKWSRGAMIRVALSEFFSRRGKIL
jgi:metal-responsive CopG/Arc/MetJ family transcriptional regulator